jgi:Family of unknown function (DUF6165)
VKPSLNKIPPTPNVQVSWGELIDKITILEIKMRRLKSQEASENVRRELGVLTSTANEVLLQPNLLCLKEQLESINEALWDIEDQIRAKEATKSFDHQFIELARAVYINNDKRGELKRQINTLLNSKLVEEKQYASYLGTDL